METYRSNFIDETGHKYGHLTVIKPTKTPDGRTGWLCKCDCGNTKIVRGSDLRRGRITSCGAGCPYKHSYSYIDETGNKYGRLTVLYRSSKSLNQKVYWHCRCDCGNECDVSSEQLRNGGTRSCGCLHNELLREQQTQDLTGQRFGKLIAIKNTGEQDKNHNRIWLCKCDCGNYKKVSSVFLIHGNTKSCGCLNSFNSIGSQKIEALLASNNIKYKKEYTFENLTGDDGITKLRFDFALLGFNGQIYWLIEYNGRQHYEPVEYFGGREKFLQQIRYDKKKIDYCNNNHIPLLIIKYDENIDKKLESVIENMKKIYGTTEDNSND